MKWKAERMEMELRKSKKKVSREGDDFKSVYWLKAARAGTKHKKWVARRQKADNGQKYVIPGSHMVDRQPKV